MPNSPHTPSPTALIIFAKNPIPGKTKTRLATDVGNEMALAMYDLLVRWAFDQAAALTPATTCYVYYSDYLPPDNLWPDASFEKRVQSGEDLGQRMHQAFTEVLAQGHQRAVIIGTDCPGITSGYLRQSFQKLARPEVDVVIGPATDGGYTLIGLTTPQLPLFDEMTWSVDTVLPQTLARARTNGLSIHLLSELSDVDYLDDWHSYGWTLPTLSNS